MRPLVAADAPALARLHAASFDRPWSATEIAELVAAGAFGLIAADGFILCREGGGEAEILSIAVRPAARGRGQGRALVEAAVAAAAGQGAETMFLEVAADNIAALALYRAAGFRAGRFAARLLSERRPAND
jgi:[ribosomal protein S18]-alanine N-acetyltransferase